MTTQSDTKSKFDTLCSRVNEIHTMLYSDRTWTTNERDRVQRAHEILTALVPNEDCPTHSPICGPTPDLPKEDCPTPDVGLAHTMHSMSTMLRSLRKTITGDTPPTDPCNGVDSMVHECDVIVSFLKCTTHSQSHATCIVL